MGMINEKGKFIVLTVVLLVMGRELMSVLQGQTSMLPNIFTFIGVLIVLVVALFTYKGKNWARWILVVLSVISLIICFISLFIYYGLNVLVPVVITDVIFSLMINIVTIISLTMNQSVSDYFEDCNSNW